MLRLRYTLVADGPSDRALLHVIDWTIKEVMEGRDCSVAARFAANESCPGNLTAKVRAALVAFPCDLIFVHRDAEAMPASVRYDEVDRAATAAGARNHVAVVPVRMTEAWLLVSPEAIRRAADQSPRASVTLPPLGRIEAMPDPKAALRQALVAAAGKTGRHHRRFTRDIGGRVQRVAAYTEDFSPLRALPSFRNFEAATRAALTPLMP